MTSFPEPTTWNGPDDRAWPDTDEDEGPEERFFELDGQLYDEETYLELRAERELAMLNEREES